MKRFHPAQITYLKIKAKNDFVLGVEKECKLKILAENEFYPEPEFAEAEPGRITSDTADYLMSDPDFEKYCRLVKAECEKYGVHTPTWDTTVDYQTRPALHKAEDALIQWGLSIVKKDLPAGAFDALQRGCNDYKIREELVSLTLNLCA